MENINKEFASEEIMAQKLRERIGEGDVVSIAIESLVDHMNELAEKRDKTNDTILSEMIDRTLDEARIKVEHLLLQMSGIIDNARNAVVSEKDIKEVFGEITDIEGLLSSVEKSEENEVDGGRGQIAA